MAKRGQPTKFRDEYCDQVYNYCSLGAIDEELAAFFGVCIQTLNTWKKEHPDFFDSMLRGKREYDHAKVEQKLRHRATGYEHPEEKVFCHQGSIVTHQTVKRYPPDTVAAIFWLKNRDPDRWKDKQEITGTQEISLSDESLAALDKATENVAELLNAVRS